jgi:ectoine hydroxylase-related dioxygenase (phytanoyl-CoA dioxygenase family)
MVMERDGNAKYAISSSTLRNYKNDFYSVNLKKGDGIFFDYSLIHGSASNGSPYDQSRLIVQLCSKELPKIKHGYDRRDHEIDILSKMLDAKQPK